MKQREFAHGFYYYTGPGVKFLGNVSYDRNCYYSYRTIIGQKLKDKFGNTQHLLSWDGMTASTATQLNHLFNACPTKAILIPMEQWRMEPYTGEDAQVAVIKEILSIYRRGDNHKLTRKAIRLSLSGLFEQLDSTVHYWEPCKYFCTHEAELADIRG